MVTMVILVVKILGEGYKTSFLYQKKIMYFKEIAVFCELHTILENKVPPNLKLANAGNNKSYSSTKNICRFCSLEKIIFDIEN